MVAWSRMESHGVAWSSGFSLPKGFLKAGLQTKPPFFSSDKLPNGYGQLPCCESKSSANRREVRCNGAHPAAMETRDRFNISRIAIEHPWLTVLFWIVLCVIGSSAFHTLKYALLPDITFPVVVVPPMSPPPKPPADTAREVSLPIEQRLKSIEG